MSLVTDRYKAQLPRGWAEATLDNIAEVILGQSPPGISYNVEGEGLPFLQGKSEFGELRPSFRKWTTDPRKLARPDDVLLSVRAPVGPTNLAPAECCIGRGLAALRPLGGIDPLYVLYGMRATDRHLAARATGTTFEAVSGAQVRAHRIPLAPLNEQRRIVAAIEEQLSRLDAADASLAAAARRLGGLRQTTLAASVDGHPTVDLGAVTTDHRYGTAVKCVAGTEGIPVLRIPNVREGRIDITDLKVATTSELGDCFVERDDLLVIRTNGSRDLIGRVAVVDDAAGMAFASYLIRVRPTSSLDPKWAVVALSSPTLRAEIESRAASTAGQYNLNLTALKSLPVPLPPLDEQRRIVAEVEARLSEIDALRDAIASAQRRSTALRAAILERAFRGELVPQDPSDEPAGALLARIHAECASTPKPRRRATSREAS